MKKSLVGALYAIGLVSILFLAGCGDDDATTSTTVTSMAAAFSNNPESNPAKLDGTAPGVTFVQEESNDLRPRFASNGAVDLQIKKVAGSGNNFGTITLNQCSHNTTISDNVAMDIVNGNGVATYTITANKRASSGSNNYDLTKVTRTDGASATITLHDESLAIAVEFKKTSSTENTLTAESRHFAWNSSGLGCANLGGTQVPFSFTINSSTGEKSAGVASSDTSQCSNLPTSSPTYSAPTAIDSTLFDCSSPTFDHTLALGSKSGLEDDGGTTCNTLSGNFFADSTASVSACSGVTATSALCYMNGYLSIIAQREKTVKRSTECAIMGVMARFAAGTLTGIDMGSFNQSSAVTIGQGNLTIGGGDD